ncbi:MAG: hypothetical protein ACOC6L_03290 [Thermodesulfobacteriota bacterium]
MKIRLTGLSVKRTWWRNWTIIACLALLGYGASVGAAWAKPLVLTAKDSGRTVTVGVGQSLVVDLELGGGQHVAAPEFDAAILNLVGQSLQSTTGPQGASSRIVYQFLVRRAGRTDLVIDLKNSGEKGARSKPLLKVKIVASGGGRTI